MAFPRLLFHPAILLFVVTITTWPSVGGAESTATSFRKPLFGFTPFPYDFTTEAVDKTRQLIVPNSGLYALHLDDGIPWKEALESKPFPARVQREWDDWASKIPPGHAVYVGLAPLAKDRKNLAPSRGERDGESLPPTLKNARLDDERVKQAYLAYARRAVLQFKPDFLNLGIEAGELASRNASHWPEFIALYDYVATTLKHEFPRLKIGISFGLQSLRDPKVARLAKPVMDKSDYLGLSFYPYMSPFGEKFGDPPLPAGTNAWREPLAWVRNFSTKPIAICETGFSSRDVQIRSFDLEFRGSPEMQAIYVHDLLQTARRDGYLFVVWFLAIDYDKLYAKMPKGSEVNLIWRNIGLLDSELRPKPAWNEWKNAIESAQPTTSVQNTNNTRRSAVLQKTTVKTIGFSSTDDLFTCMPNSSIQLEPASGTQNTASMRWNYNYARGEWAWCTKKFTPGRLSGTSRMQIWVKSDRNGPLFLQLEEDGGEAFFTTIQADTNWRQTTLNLAEFRVDPAKKQNSQLEAERINAILLADSDARNGATGLRTVWLSHWNFE